MSKRERHDMRPCGRVGFRAAASIGHRLSDATHVFASRFAQGGAGHTHAQVVGGDRHGMCASPHGRQHLDPTQLTDRTRDPGLRSVR